LDGLKIGGIELSNHLEEHVEGIEEEVALIAQPSLTLSGAVEIKA
jgi:hypothetical protein